MTRNYFQKTFGGHLRRSEYNMPKPCRAFRPGKEHQPGSGGEVIANCGNKVTPTSLVFCLVFLFVYYYVYVLRAGACVCVRVCAGARAGARAACIHCNRRMKPVIVPGVV